MRGKPTTINSILARCVVTTSGCFEWQGYTDRHGYASIGFGGHKRLGHRVVYQLVIGPVPRGLVLDHLCRNRKCLNVAHLEPVTIGANVRRGTGPVANNARKLYCKHGHRFTTINTYLRPDGSGRDCKQCRTDVQSRRVRNGKS